VAAGGKALDDELGLPAGLAVAGAPWKTEHPVFGTEVDGVRGPEDTGAAVSNTRLTRSILPSPVGIAQVVEPAILALTTGEDAPSGAIAR
jgi:hypothetical protein